MKRTRMEKGITLIALLVTIVVLIILAAVTISTLGDEEEGVITRAQAAGTKYNTAEKNQKQEMSNYIAFIDKYDPTASSNKIPAGAVYYTGYIWAADPNDSSVMGQPNHHYTTKLVAGQEFPETLTPGDVYVYGDYAYMYGIEGDMQTFACYYNGEAIVTGGIGYLNNSLDGWGVKYIGNGSVPGELLSEIRGKNVVSLQLAFGGTAITTAPTIPSTIKNLNYAFHICESLSGAITINSTPTSYSGCIEGTNVTQILGSCSESVKAAIMATK